MWVINVFSGDRRRPIVDKTSAASVRRACACCLVPDTARHQSSAYAEVRVMPTWFESCLFRAVGGSLMSA
jgi:hypothetical protein